MSLVALTEKQKRFADEYLIDLNATRAYKVAYPSCKKNETARTNGSRLLTNANVSEYVKRLQEKIESEKIMTAKERQEVLTEIARDRTEKPDSRIKAIDTLNKMSGQYINKVEVSGLENEKSKLDSLIQQMRGGSDE